MKACNGCNKPISNNNTIGLCYGCKVKQGLAV